MICFHNVTQVTAFQTLDFNAMAAPAVKKNMENTEEK
jgi:hypothetical protein